MKILLIRHAQSQANVNKHLVGGRSSDVPLSPLGVEQADQLGTLLKSFDGMLARVVSSPAVRTQETARLSLQLLSEVPTIQIETAVEEMSQGRFEGRPRDEVYTDEIKEQIELLGKDFSLPDEGAESMNDVAQPDDTVLVYTHGIAICCYIGRLLGLSQQEIFERTRQLPNASYTELVFSESSDTPEIRAFGVAE
jgi:broad specificity phosphatase PhoE